MDFSAAQRLEAIQEDWYAATEYPRDPSVSVAGGKPTCPGVDKGDDASLKEELRKAEGGDSGVCEEAIRRGPHTHPQPVHAPGCPPYGPPVPILQIPFPPAEYSFRTAHSTCKRPQEQPP